MELFIMVMIGAILGTCVHEFGHALAAYYGGDYTVKEKGYLNFDPTKYTHPVTTFLMPMLFLLMGGVPLPGGAVYIETELLRNKWWQSLTSLAGPLGSLLFALLCASPFMFGFTPAPGPNVAMVWYALAYLAVIELMISMFNLIPLPPFDGFGVIKPHLNHNLQQKADELTQYAFIIVLILIMWDNGPVRYLWEWTYLISQKLHIPWEMVAECSRAIRFWHR